MPKPPRTDWYVDAPEHCSEQFHGESWEFWRAVVFDEHDVPLAAGYGDTERAAVQVAKKILALLRPAPVQKARRR